MKSFLITWLVAAAALAITAQIVPGLVVTSFVAAAIAAIIMGLVNAVVRPILIILTLPITLVTLGLFLLVINALTLQLVGFLSPGFDVESFWSAILGSIVLSIVSSLLDRFVVPQITDNKA